MRAGEKMPTVSDFLFKKSARVPQAPLPVESPLEAWKIPSNTGLRVTWLGHSTTLIEIDGLRILTDPVWGERASPSSLVGPRRFHKTPVAIHQLPPLDVVLVSHDHYDHLDYQAIRELAVRDVPFVTSLGVGAHLEAWGVRRERITELDWWEEASFGGLVVTATPSRHFSGRGLVRNGTLWSSWVMKTERHAVFFSGDTGLTEEFRAIGQRKGPFDLVMLEVGAYHPAWGDIHLGPDNAILAHEMLGSGTLLPVHWGTFDLAVHPWQEPAETLARHAEKSGLRLLTPRVGRPVEPALTERVDAWWRELVAAPTRERLSLSLDPAVR